MSLSRWGDLISSGINCSLDLIVLVVSAHDRVDVANTGAIKLLKHFVTKLNYDRCAIVFTHCDQVPTFNSSAWVNHLNSCVELRETFQSENQIKFGMDINFIPGF